MDDFNAALRALEIEERAVRLLERRAKALACIEAAGAAGSAGGAGEVPEATTLQRFMSSYARRGDAGETTTIAASTFYSKYSQYLAGRGVQRDLSRKVCHGHPLGHQLELRLEVH